jgi:uncharacterized protein (TIGR00369 family)
MNTVTDVAAHIKQIWSSSAFMNLLKIEIDEIHCGGATVKMPIDFDIHTNHWLGVHGGALAALADAVMGITGASVGEVVQTLSFNINFISNLPGTGTAIVKSQVKHHGQTTMVIMAEMTDEQNNLLAALRRLCLSPDILMRYPENGNEGMKY